MRHLAGGGAVGQQYKAACGGVQFDDGDMLLLDNCPRFPAEVMKA